MGRIGKIVLQSGEVVIRQISGVSVRSILLDLTLTTRRLVIADGRNDPPTQKNIPLASIREIRLEEDTAKNPAINLSVMTENGALRHMIIAFTPFEGVARIADCKEWIQLLEDRTSSTRATTHVNILTPSKIPHEIKPGTLPVEESTPPPKERDWVPDFTPFLSKTKPETGPEPPKKSKFIIVGTVVIVVLVILGIVIAAGIFSKGRPAAQQNPQTIATMTKGATPVPTPSVITTTIIPTAAVSLTPTAPPKYLIPTKGIWMRVQCPGAYTGYVGAGGMNVDVNTTGEWFHQFPITSGTIEGVIEKQDGSTDNLIVELYKDGALLSRQNTVTPHGILYIHIPVSS